MTKTKVTTLCLGLLLILLLAGAVWAGQSADFAIDWRVMSGGGAPAASAGGVAMNGSIGQTAVGKATGGGSISLDSGYWTSMAKAEWRLHFSAVMK